MRLNQMIISRLFYEIVPICITTYSSEQEGKFFLRYDGSHHLLRPHGTMQGKAQRAVVPFYNPL